MYPQVGHLTSGQPSGYITIHFPLQIAQVIRRVILVGAGCSSALLDNYELGWMYLVPPMLGIQARNPTYQE